MSVPIAISHIPSAAATAAPAGRAPGDALAIGRISGRAEMRIRTNSRIGEFRHVGLGDNDRASRTQPVHDRRINCSGFRFLSERLRARARHLARNVKQVLDADDSAIERAK